MEIYLRAHTVMDTVVWTVSGRATGDGYEDGVRWVADGQYPLPDAPHLLDEVAYLCWNVQEAIGAVRG